MDLSRQQEGRTTMSQLTQPTTAEIVSRYVAVWGEPDPQARRAAIEGLWAPDGAEFLEGIQFRGHAELDAGIDHAYNEFIGSGRFVIGRADDLTSHGDLVTFTVQLLGPGNEVGWSARVFLLLDDDGTIREDYHLTIQPLAA